MAAQPPTCLPASANASDRADRAWRCPLAAWLALFYSDSGDRDEPYGATAARRQLQLQDRLGIHAALFDNRVLRLRRRVGSVGVDLRIVGPAPQKTQRNVEFARVPVRDAAHEPLGAAAPSGSWAASRTGTRANSTFR